MADRYRLGPGGGVYVVFLILCVSSVATAQTDLNAITVTGSVSAVDNGLQTNQYVKKPKKARKKLRAPASENQPPASAASQSPQPNPDLQNAQVTPLPRLNNNVTVSAEFDNSGVPQPDSQNSQDSKLGFGGQLRDLFLGGDFESMDKYRSFLDSDDIRKNIFELTLATSYMYNTSESPYFYRNYIDSAPGAYVGLDLWLTPFFGIDADYRSTLLDEVKDSPTQDIYDSASQTWFGMGVKFRRFFGMALNSSSFTVGLRYTDFNFSVPPSALYRLKTDSQGPELTLDLSVPVTRSYSWTFGITVDPYITHTENPVGPDIESGDSNQTVGLGAELGGEYRLCRQARAYFKISALVYKTLFADQSAAVDPVDNSLALNVPVSNVFYMIDLGLHLGR